MGSTALAAIGVRCGGGIEISPAPSLTVLLRNLPLIIGPIVFGIVATCGSKLVPALGLVVAIAIPFGVISPFVQIVLRTVPRNAGHADS
jgi:hypothetical protein